jgi:hypothetical protein
VDDDNEDKDKDIVFVFVFVFKFVEKYIFELNEILLLLLL